MCDIMVVCPEIGSIGKSIRKNLTARITRIVSAILLVFGTIFAAVFMNTPSSYVYAVENDNPGINITPDDNTSGGNINIQLDDENTGNNNPGINITPDGDTSGGNINITPDGDTSGGNINIQPGNEGNNPDNPENPDTEDQPNPCEDQVGALAWIVCPTTGVIAKFIDAIYNVVDGLSVVPPLSI